MANVTDGIVCVQFRVICAILILFGTIYNFFVKLLYGTHSKKRLPITDDDIFKKSATEIAYEIRCKKVTSYEVVQKFIKRQRAVNSILNAIVSERYKEALIEAQQVDEFLASTTLTESEIATKKPLLGVPVSVKGSLACKGMNFEVGSKERIGIIADENSESVSLLLSAGAIPLCTTTTPEYCLSIETTNLVTGRTNNPYNVLYTCGGSSGGEGALIGSGGSVCGIGSDISGSIRIPAAFCGIFGHKPTTGVTSLEGHIPYADHPIYRKHLGIGPLARYAEDLPLMMKVLTKNNPALKLDEAVKLSDLKFYYMLDTGNCFGAITVHPKIKERIRESIDHFRKRFDCEISDYKFDEIQFINEAGIALFISMEDDAVPNVNVFWQALKTFVGRGEYSFARLFYFFMKYDKLFMPSDIDKMQEFITYFEQKVNLELGPNGVFLYPTFPTSAFRHGASMFYNPSVSYLSVANTLGLPSTSVPVGFTEEGLPIAIQVIAARYQDRLCMAVAKELENLFGGWMPPY